MTIHRRRLLALCLGLFGLTKTVTAQPKAKQGCPVCKTKARIPAVVGRQSVIVPSPQESGRVLTVLTTGTHLIYDPEPIWAKRDPQSGVIQSFLEDCQSCGVAYRVDMPDSK